MANCTGSKLIETRFLISRFSGGHFRWVFLKEPEQINDLAHATDKHESLVVLRRSDKPKHADCLIYKFSDKPLDLVIAASTSVITACKTVQDREDRSCSLYGLRQTLASFGEKFVRGVATFIGKLLSKLNEAEADWKFQRFVIHACTTFKRSKLSILHSHHRPTQDSRERGVGEAKRSEAKRSEAKRSEAKRSEAKRAHG
jgi:hypothetical protein